MKDDKHIAKSDRHIAHSEMLPKPRPKPQPKERDSQDDEDEHAILDALNSEQKAMRVEMEKHQVEEGRAQRQEARKQHTAAAAWHQTEMPRSREEEASVIAAEALCQDAAAFQAAQRAHPAWPQQQILTPVHPELDMLQFLVGSTQYLDR